MLEQIELLLEQLKVLPAIYGEIDNRVEQLVEIYRKTELIIKFIAKENPSQWESTYTGFNHTGDYHISTLEDNKLSRKRKVDAYKTAHEQLTQDLEYILSNGSYYIANLFADESKKNWWADNKHRFID